MNKLTTNSLANYCILAIFIFLHPFAEWPDTNTYFERDYFYVNYIKNILNFLDIYFPLFKDAVYSDYFSDTFFFEKNTNSILLNLLKLPAAYLMLYFINIQSYKATKDVIVFSPVLIFSLLSISNESFAITFIIISFFLILQKKLYLPIFFAILSIILDRAMLASLIGIILYLLVFNLNYKVNKYLILSLIFILFISLGFLIVNLNISFIQTFLSFFGISNLDIKYNQNFGETNYLAIVASLSGLYGWMSLRPFPWLIYYSFIIGLFLIGFTYSDSQYKIKFICFVLPVILTLMVLPPLSQARYFPILTIFYWEGIMHGAKIFFKGTNITVILIIFMTFLGLLSLNLQ